MVVHLGTFSKTLAPGHAHRLAGRPEASSCAPLTIAKQAADLHSGTLAQRAAAALLARFDYDGAPRRGSARVYGERCDAMLDALERHLPAGTRWTQPDGGLFIWAELALGPERRGALRRRALARRWPSSRAAPFFADAPRHEMLRLNFSNRPPELIEEGIARLGRVVARRLD